MQSREYRYKQRGAEEGEEIEIEKNNPEDFEKALCQMVYVMHCIIQGVEFDEATFININRHNFEPEMTNNIALVVMKLTERKKDDDICAEFGRLFTDDENNVFPNSYILSRKGSLLEYMEENEGVVEAYFAEEHNQNLLAQFFDEARNHKELVLQLYPSIKH